MVCWPDLRERVGRKKERQNNIYCVTDASVFVVSSSPFLVFKKGLVVLFDGLVDEYAVSGIGHFAEDEKKPLGEKKVEFAGHVETHSRGCVWVDSATAENVLMVSSIRLSAVCQESLW